MERIQSCEIATRLSLRKRLDHRGRSDREGLSSCGPGVIDSWLTAVGRDWAAMDEQSCCLKPEHKSNKLIDASLAGRRRAPVAAAATLHVKLWKSMVWAYRAPGFYGLWAARSLGPLNDPKAPSVMAPFC